jgi:hypothetical protein
MAIFFLDPSDARVKPAFQRFLDNVLGENGVTPENHHLVPYRQAQLSAYRFTPARPRGRMSSSAATTATFRNGCPWRSRCATSDWTPWSSTGPGQGTALDAGIPMTADWHLPAAAIVDYFKLTDITMLGFSLGADWSSAQPRASRGSAA